MFPATSSSTFSAKHQVFHVGKYRGQIMHAYFLRLLITSQVKNKLSLYQDYVISGWAGPGANSCLIIGKLGLDSGNFTSNIE